MLYIKMLSNKDNNKVFQVNVKKDNYYKKRNNWYYMTYYKWQLVDWWNDYATKKETFDIAKERLNFIS